MKGNWEEQKTRGRFEQRFGELHRDTELVLGYRPFAIVFHRHLSTHKTEGENLHKHASNFEHTPQA